MSSGVPVNYIHGGNKQGRTTPNAFPPVEAGTSALQSPAQRGKREPGSRPREHFWSG